MFLPYFIFLYDKVNIDDLKLSSRETKILIEMVGKRFNTGKRQIKLVTERFPNRIENKKYLMFLLETLVNETRQLAKVDENSL